MRQDCCIPKVQKIRLGIVSIYPPAGSRHAFLGAVAAYTRGLVDYLDKERFAVRIYANILDSGKREYEAGREIIRCWRKGGLSVFQILRNVLKDKPQIVHLQHEFFLYGGISSAFLFPLLLLALRLAGVRTLVTVHGVVPLSSVNKSFVVENRMNIAPFLAKAGFLVLIKAISASASRVIVHENKFLQVLIKEYGCKGEKIKVIPMGIEERADGLPPGLAKEKLGLGNKRIIMYFGYITGYKGIEILIDAFGFLKRHSDYALLIAGGEHPRFKKNRDYQEYVLGLKRRSAAISPSQIIFTDFIPEEEIAGYFSAAEIVVFPYTVGMASSSAMSLAIAYNKPFIVSDAFRDVVGFSEAVFENNAVELAKKIEGFLTDASGQEKLLALTKRLKEERSSKRIGELTAELYTGLLPCGVN